MLESNFNAANQMLTTDLAQLKHRVSVTDGCISWEETEALVMDARARLGGKSSKPSEAAVASV